MQFKKNFPTVLLMFLPAIIYLPGILGWIPFSSSETDFTDLLISHYPNALYLKNSILSYHQIPLWSNLVNSGAPFAANPLSSLFYLPAWLSLLFPLPEGISIVLGLHGVFGAWGMYLFLRREGLKKQAAILGSLIFSISPKIAVHYGAGHVTLIYALYWTPWLFYISNNDQRGWKTGLVAAGLFLADPRWAIPAGLIWFSYVIAHRQFRTIKHNFDYFLKAGLTAFLISSPLILPMLQYVRLSTRTEMRAADIFGISLPIRQLIGLIIPASGGNFEWFVYFGAIPILLFIETLISRNARKNRFWISWAAIGIFLSVAPNYLTGGWLETIPGLTLLRVPARNMFLLSFSLAVISARAIDQFLENKQAAASGKYYIFAGTTSVALMIGISILLGGVKLNAIWGLVIYLLACAAFILSLKGVMKIKATAWIVAMLVVVDLFYAGFSNIVFRPMPEQRNQLIDVINEDSNIFRTYSPSYSIPQEIAAESGIQLSDGVDPLQIAEYKEFMEKATGVANPGYSVTIPPYESGNPQLDNMKAEPDPFLLGLINVKYLLSDFELDTPGLFLKEHSEDQYLYQNELWLPYAWVETTPLKRDDLINSDLDGTEIILRTPNKITLVAEGPGRLVVAEIFYPGWQARIDNEIVPIEANYEILRSVQLPPGIHQIDLTFMPPVLILGLSLGLAGLALSILGIWKGEQ